MSALTIAPVPITVVRLTLPVPSKDTAEASTSPVSWKLRPVCKAVAVAALPVALPAEPDTLPVTLPVRLPVNVPAIAPVPVIVGLVKVLSVKVCEPAKVTKLEIVNPCGFVVFLM